MDEEREYPIVEVFWEDACWQYDAAHRIDFPELQLERTAGWLVDDEPDVIRIAQTHDDFGYRSIVAIPRGNIINVQIFRKGDSAECMTGPELPEQGC